ncbi:MAG: acyltransferase family protein, partial [Eubacteriales bacterium]
WNSYYLGFVLGILICDLYCHREQFIKNRALKWLLLAVGLYLGSFPDINPVSKVLYGYLHFSDSIFIVYHTIGAALIISVVINSLKITKILSLRLFQFLGKLSFSMYLTHVAVLFYIAYPIFKNLQNQMIPYKYCFLITAAIYLGITFAFSYLMYLFIDQNGIKFSNYLYNRFFHHENDSKKYGLVDLKKHQG